MARRQLVTIGIIMLMALQALGVAYGSWFEDTTLAGQVESGSVDLYFENVVAAQWFTDSAGQMYLPADWPVLFAATMCSAKFDPEIGSPNAALADNPQNYDTGPDWLQVLVEGAYPGYSCLVTFDITSGGSVPVELRFRPGDAHAADALVEYFHCASVPVTEAGIQLHEGESTHCALLIGFSNADGVGENQEYLLSYSIEADQWNEAGTP